MNRRNFLGLVPFAAGWPSFSAGADRDRMTGHEDLSSRSYWVETMDRIARPVISGQASGILKQTMPLEKGKRYGKNVQVVTYLEAFGRALAGLAPWLALPVDGSFEGRLRKDYLELALKGIELGVTPGSPGYLNFSAKGEGQLLVDAAFLAEALLRAPEALWHNLDRSAKKKLISAFQSLRWIEPPQNNWLLFAGIIEAFLWYAGADANPDSISMAVNKITGWYKGDGWYGDGQHFHFDYYNNYVMHPMLLECMGVLQQEGKCKPKEYDLAIRRMQRNAEIMERLIAPDGSYPVVGRSMPYRTAAFQNLAWLGWKEQLPDSLPPAQVRTALTAVCRRIYDHPETFDEKGWLRLGLCGHQPSLADNYTSTGSLYLCLEGFLALGLPAGHAFWTGADKPWTSVRAWRGDDLEKDYYAGY